MISQKNYLAFHYTCQSGDLEWVQLVIEQGAKNWNRGLRGACKGGHRDLAEWMIQKGAVFCSNCFRSMEEHRQ